MYEEVEKCETVLVLYFFLKEKFYVCTLATYLVQTNLSVQPCKLLIWAT